MISLCKCGVSERVCMCIKYLSVSMYISSRSNHPNTESLKAESLDMHYVAS
jgi:hypothetical protein